MLKTRTETWLALGVLGIALIPVGILGLWGYMSTTATPLHPSAKDAPSVTNVASSPLWRDATEQARQIVRAGLVEQNLPGLSVAVGVGGDLVWAEGFGWADLEKRVPVAPDMTFRIGTASTVLTSAAVGLLLEDGRLKLDEKIQTYVPSFLQTYAPALPGKQWTVTLRQLMAHIAGIANDGGDEGPLYTKHCERPVDALQIFSGYERELSFEPGTQYQYSSYGWIVVSAAVEAAANEPFLTFMRARVFEPLGMRDTRADSATESIANRVTPYFPRFAADPRYGLHLMRPIDYSCYAGSSVFLSTPSDLVRFGMAINSGKLLQPATVQLLQLPQRLASGQETGYGLGWDVETGALAGAQARWVGHDGTSLGGTVASLRTFPEHGLVVAVTSNISYADTPTVASTIAEVFANRPRTSRSP
jgi:serine beta-lactamase-like protein LACTB, mitochondrial